MLNTFTFRSLLPNRKRDQGGTPEEEAEEDGGGGGVQEREGAR